MSTIWADLCPTFVVLLVMLTKCYSYEDFLLGVWIFQCFTREVSLSSSKTYIEYKRNKILFYACTVRIPVTGTILKTFAMTLC